MNGAPYFGQRFTYHCYEETTLPHMFVMSDIGLGVVFVDDIARPRRIPALGKFLESKFNYSRTSFIRTFIIRSDKYPDLFFANTTSIPGCNDEVNTWMACDAEDSGFQMLNDDEVVTSVKGESDPVDDKTDDYNNESKESSKF
ncbi:hypothetical protein TNCV_233541 [Trichonephila clavipes]|nr:hypothetical protein TNCV_233541 [Trichonephila clavipes]